MNWVIGIQRAIDYIEENLCEKIDYDEAAKCAYSSVFHFQRIFSMLCGFTVGDYIRQIQDFRKTYFNGRKYHGLQN